MNDVANSEKVNSITPDILFSFYLSYQITYLIRLKDSAVSYYFSSVFSPEIMSLLLLTFTITKIYLKYRERFTCRNWEGKH